MEKRFVTEPNVELDWYTPNPEIAVAKRADLCYSEEGPKKDISLEDARKAIRRIPIKHKSIFEHAVYGFYIDGISRACSHQIVRHRIVSYSQRSQRYVNESNGRFVFPKDLVELMGEEWTQGQLEKNSTAYRQILKKYAEKGIKGEKANENARYLLPNAAETKLYMTINASSLLNFLNLRTCNRAQEEVRIVANKMFALVYPTAPSIFEKAGPDCFSIGCKEGKRSCGKMQEVKDYFEGLKTLKS